MKRIIEIVFFLLSVQAYTQNQHQPQQWFKLYSPYVHVIYKVGQEDEAQKIANTINYIQKNNSKSIGYHYEPVDIILRSNTVESNGFVTVSPFRSEFFNTAPATFSSLGTTDWISTLAIHEYRHVQQFLNHKTGITNVLYHLFGESGWGLGSVLAMPDWYFEGDAVVMETALSESGRGRLPHFSALQRSLANDGISYSYQKIRNQSFKNVLPNHYPTGYQMLNYYRNHFNAARLNDITHKAASYQFPFYPFSYQLKKETGLTTKTLYQKTAEENQKIWQAQRDMLATEVYPQYSPKKEKVAYYSFPQTMDNGNIVALKTSLDEIATFYEIDTQGNEHKITSSIITEDTYFQYQHQQLLFTGFSYHTRYNYTSYHDIYVYDLDTHQRKKITKKQRYFSPSFNADNSKIVAVSVNEGAYQLDILDIQGNLLNSFKLSGVLSRSKFIDENNLVYLKQKKHRLAIFKMDIHSQQETQITPWSSHSLDDIFIKENQVYYSASYNGIDNIYASPLDGSQQIHQITNTTIGAYQPSVKDNFVYFREITSTGSKISFAQIQPKDFVLQEPLQMDWNQQKTVHFEGGTILDTIPNNTYPTKGYKTSLQDLEFHDWNYSLSEQIISANITATTLLNDFTMIGGIDIYTNENNSFGASFTGSYRKWFPFLNLTTEYTHRDFDTTAQDAEGTVINGIYTGDELSILPSITVPFSQINGNYSNNMELNVGYEYSGVFNRVFKVDQTGQEVENENINLNFLNTSFSAASTRRTATQNINPIAGFSTQVEFIKGFNNSGDFSFFNQHYFSTFNRLFLPGLVKSHNSYISLSYQKNEIQQTDSFNYARGFEDITSPEVSKLSLNYQMPLYYPDFGLLGITYFKRIRANLFADFSSVSYLEINALTESIRTTNAQQNSAGFEIIFDNTFFNIKQALIGIGYRGSYLLTDDIQKPNNKFVSSIFISTTLF